IRLGFPTCEAAIAYAEREGLPYTVIPTPTKTLKLQSYADNFR
ncbi:MAG: NADH dehydrogenase ubiquinone Fe-S protein 4, partial [Pseudomonadota bacterium]|nr:NADH dehydrogenase ubiquinone Fe-S protein 4 [Pseudomonadota bacterium]